MMVFHRKNKKEYDGPANNTTAVEYQNNALHALDAIKQQQQQQHDTARHNVHQLASNNGSRRVSSSSSSSNNKPLASGISSRRTSTKVRNHLPAHMMSSPIIDDKDRATGNNRRGSSSNNRRAAPSSSSKTNRESEISIPTIIGVHPDDVSVISGVNSVAMPDNNNTHMNKNKTKRREVRPQLPMEHDGGVLCVCAIPPSTNNTTTRRGGVGGQQPPIKHRFLSGSADGTIKQWEVETSSNDSNNMAPKLIKTYKGHSGYVHSIAILGTAYDPTSIVNNNSSTISESGRKMTRPSFMRKTSNEDYCFEIDSTTSQTSGGSNNNNNQRHKPISLPTIKRRSSLLSEGSTGSSNGRHQLQRPKKRLWFVSASRDNTLRIWPVADDNTTTSSDYQHQHNVSNRRGSQNSTLDDSSERSNDSSGLGRIPSRDPNSDHHDILSKGIKLRGHQFGKNNIGGVLCVASVPSIAPDSELLDADHCDTGYRNKSNGSLGANSRGSQTDISSSTGGMVSAGQFVSGGCDGCIRVWDVKSALNIANVKKIPKSVTEMKSKKLNELQCEGMYATVQLQCIKPPAAPGSSKTSSSENRFPAAITSVICTYRGSTGLISSNEEVSMFAGDAGGTIRRYSRMNECGSGHVNGAIWWGCTGIFAGHAHQITSMSMLISPRLMPLLCPNVEVEDSDVGTMLVSSCDDGWVRVWDAFDARIKHTSLDGSESDDEYVITASGKIPKRKAMWEIELNDSGGGSSSDASYSVSTRTSDRRRINAGGRIGVTSLTTLQAGTLMAAGTTDGAIRMWNVSSGLYEGAYNLGKSVQIWSLDMLSEKCDDSDDDESDEEDRIFGKEEKSVGIIVSGDNRGRIRVLRKRSTTA